MTAIAQAQDDDAELVTFLRHQAFAASRTSHARAQEIGQRLGVAADRIEALARLSATTPDTTVLVEALTYIRRQIAGGLHVGQPQLKLIDAALASTANPTGETSND